LEKRQEYQQRQQRFELLPDAIREALEREDTLKREDALEIKMAGAILDPELIPNIPLRTSAFCTSLSLNSSH
jgi:hypothetical protein